MFRIKSLAICFFSKKSFEKGVKTHLDVVIIKDRRMIFQLVVDVWGQKTCDFWSHTMLRNKRDQQT